MRRPSLLTLSGLWLILGLATGCRSIDNAQVDLMERELRQQEDYIYELEDYLMEYSEKLRQYRMASHDQGAVRSAPAKNQRPVNQPELVVDPPRTRSSGAGGRPSRMSPKPPAAEPIEPAQTPAAPAEPKPTPESVDPREMEVPNLEIGEPTSALPWKRADQIATVADGGGNAPLMAPDPADYLVDADAPADVEGPSFPEPIAPVLPQVVDETRLTAQRLEVRHVFAQPPTAENSSNSLLVVIEALNTLDEPVDADGKISVMVMAGSAEGGMQRVDRWDFTDEETRAAWQTSQLGDGLHLELPLGETELPEGPLELWARLVNDGGAKLLSRRPFEAATLVAIQDAAAAIEATAEASPSVSIPKAAPSVGPVVAEARAPEPPAPAPKWRASAEAAAASPGARVEGFASTLSPSGSGWASRSARPAPRVASEPAKSAPARWHNGATKTR